MPKDVVFSSKDLEKFTKYLRKNPDVMLRHSQVAMKKSTLILEASAKKHAPSSEGTLRKGIKSSIRPTRGTVVATAKHSIYVHEGTRPHWPPYQPNSPLDRWARSKGIPAFLVARAIARKGTKAQPFMEEAMRENKSRVYKFFEKALDDTIKELAKA